MCVFASVQYASWGESSSVRLPRRGDSITVFVALRPLIAKVGTAVMELRRRTQDDARGEYMKSQHLFRFAVAPEFTTAADWTETCAGSYIMKVRQSERCRWGLLR